MIRGQGFRYRKTRKRERAFFFDHVFRKKKKEIKKITFTDILYLKHFFTFPFFRMFQVEKAIRIRITIHHQLHERLEVTTKQ